MPQGLDDISKIRYLYLELNKRLHYDNNYRFTDQTTRDEMLNKITTFNNLEGNKVVCKGWAELFRELLIKNGVPEDSVNVVGEQHRWVEINIGDKIIRADATDLFNGTFDLDTSKNGSSTVGFLLLDNSYKGVNLNNKFDSNGNPVLDSNGNPTRIYKTLGDEYYNNVSNWLREIDNKIGYTDNGLYYLENLEKAKNEFYSPSLVEKIFGVNKQKEYDTKLTKFLDIKVPDGMDAYESIFYFERVRDVIFGDLAKNISVYPMKRILPDGTIVAATIIKTTGLDVYDTKHLKIIDDVSGVSDILDFDNLGQVENYLKSSGYVAWTK